MTDLIRDRYEPIVVAGSGGQGEVLRARDHQHRRDVAIKVRAVDPDVDREAVLAEARVLLELDPHPNLPRVGDDFFEGDRYYMVVDWVEGKSLEKLLEERGDPGLPASRVLGWMQQVATALDHLHGHRPPIVHQDVKPANIILRDDGRVILVDFGIAGVAGEARSAGTRGYMSPEVASGGRPVPASDIYSLAATAFALLTGAPPAGGALAWEGVAAEGAGPIERALRRALAVDPARRPGSASDLVEQLRAWIGRALPSGTVTFLFTDIEGSTRLLQALGARYAEVRGEHHKLLRGIFAEHRGIEVGTEGDSFFEVFERASDAAAAALAAQRALAAHRWPEGADVRVRMGLHTGEAAVTPEGYVGLAVHQAARIAAAGHGGQVLLSEATANLVGSAPPETATLRDLGAHLLKDLQRPEPLFQLCHPELPSDFPPLRSLSVLPNNLPVQLTSFIGRARELAAANEVLERARLVTFTGLGGSGKTRLALQVAAEVLESFRDGVWLVELAPLSDAEAVPQALASSLGLQEEAGKSIADTIVEWCASRALLVILDTCEHLLGACASLTERLLRACRDVRVIATSSEPLAIAGEATFPVPTLPSEEAVELFADRARAAKPGFALDERNQAAVEGVCARLDGIPLAIELAAARVKVLAPEQIAARLDDRFRLLTGGSRTALPHQQTMRAALDWSYEPLGEGDKRLFARLAAFAGSFPLEAVERVCAGDGIDELEVLDLLQSLVDKSLLVAEEAEGEARYRFLQTVQQYAREKLAASGEADAVRDRHLEYFLELAERAWREISGTAQVTWLLRLDVAHDDLLVATERGLATYGDERALRIAVALTDYWRIRGFLREGRVALERNLDNCPQAAPDIRGLGLANCGLLCWRQGDFARARELLEQGLQIQRQAGDERGVAMILNNLGVLISDQGEYEHAEALMRESLEIRRSLGELDRAVELLVNLGVIAYERGHFDAAEERYREALPIAERMGNVEYVAAIVSNLGMSAYARRDFPTARRYISESLEKRRALGDRPGVANSLVNLGEVALEEDDFARAKEALEGGLGLAREIGERLDEARALRGLGALTQRTGGLEEARALLQESLAIVQEVGDRLERARILRSLGGVLLELGERARGISLLEEAQQEFSGVGNAQEREATKVLMESLSSLE